MSLIALSNVGYILGTFSRLSNDASLDSLLESGEDRMTKGQSQLMKRRTLARFVEVCQSEYGYDQSQYQDNFAASAAENLPTCHSHRSV